MNKSVVALALALTALRVEADGITFGLAAASRDDFVGAEIGFGYYFKVSQIEINLLPITAIINAESKTNQYRNENAAACESLDNWNERCSGRLSYAAIAIVDYKFSEQLAVGGGVRAGKKADLFWTLGLGRFVSLSGKIARVQISVGGKYMSLGFMTGF